MSIGPLQALVDRLRQAAPNGGGLSDAELVERWARHHDEAAFELIVWRHGRLVLSVCRRLLGHAADVEDAFQATFLVLVRKARSISRRQALASWLHTVATRVALQARDRGARERARTCGAVEDLAAKAVPGPADDLRAVLDEEIARLSEKYRVVFILCCLEGKTDAAAARELGCPLGTVLSRLSRARRRLRERLERRGVTPSASLPALAGAAHLPSVLLETTVGAAVALAAGSPAAPAAVALMEGVVHAMFVTKLKSTSLAVMMFALLGVGGLAGYGGLSAQEGTGAAADRPARRGSGDTRPARNVAQRDTTTRDLQLQLEQAQLQLQSAQALVERIQKALKAAQDKKAPGRPSTAPETTTGDTPTSSGDLAIQKSRIEAAKAEHESALATLAEAKRKSAVADKLLKMGPSGAVSREEVEVLRAQLTKSQAEADLKKALLRVAELAAVQTITPPPRSRPSSTDKPSSLEQRVKTLEDQLKAMQKELQALRGRRGSPTGTTLPGSTQP